MFFSASKVLAISLLATSVAAHGKIAVATGDQGGNGTALGIQGAVVPGAGRNKVTEPDTTVFAGDQADACGKTKGAGDNDVETGTQQAMALSGSTLPQVSSGGSVSGTLHIVTSDGAGPYTAMLDTTGTGTQWSQIEVTQQVPGNNGNIKKTEKRFWARALQSVGLMKRATNINEDYPFSVKLPADMSCTGTAAGQSNVCMVKLVNPSNAGPFGGCIPVQQAGAGNSTTAATTTAATTRKIRKLRA